MRAGQLRHTIFIQESVSVSDGMGGSVLTWRDKFKTRAAIWPLRSKEQLDAGKLESEMTNQIRIRFRTGITSKNRIKFGSRIFNIKGNPINHEERNIYLDLIVSEDI